jgi:hypothetical protein
LTVNETEDWDEPASHAVRVREISAGGSGSCLTVIVELASPAEIVTMPTRGTPFGFAPAAVSVMLSPDDPFIGHAYSQSGAEEDAAQEL